MQVSFSKNQEQENPAGFQEVSILPLVSSLAAPPCPPAGQKDCILGQLDITQEVSSTETSLLYSPTNHGLSMEGGLPRCISTREHGREVEGQLTLLMLPLAEEVQGLTYL